LQQQFRASNRSSTVSDDKSCDEAFIETLRSWRDRALLIDTALVAQLLKQVEPLAKQLKKIKAHMEAEVRSTLQDFAATTIAEHQRKLVEQEHRSHLRLATGEAYARVGTVSTSRGEYDSLLVEPGYDLTDWVTGDKLFAEESRVLDRLSMYPVLFTDTLRMGLVRLGQTRITYVWERFERYEAFQLADNNFNVQVAFPSRSSRKENVLVTLFLHSEKVAAFSLLFSGYGISFIDGTFTRNCPAHIRGTIQKRLFKSESAISIFFKQQFTAFRGQYFDICEKNIRDFFQDRRYRLSLIEYVGVPILLAKRCVPKR
jgi:hypothetical protein